MMLHKWRYCDVCNQRIEPGHPYREEHYPAPVGLALLPSEVRGDDVRRRARENADATVRVELCPACYARKGPGTSGRDAH